MTDYDLAGAKSTKDMAERFAWISKGLESLTAELGWFLGAIDAGRVELSLVQEVDVWADRLRALVDDAETRAGMIAHAFGEFPPNTSIRTGQTT